MRALRSSCMWRRRVDGERGQTLVELGITIVLFMMLSLGIVEFGRILMIVSVVTHAARDGARAAAVATNRDVSGNITDTSSIKQRVRDQLANVVGTADANDNSKYQVAVTQVADGGIPMVEVKVTGSVPYLFAPLLFGSTASLGIDRAVRFRDEGKA